MANLGFQASGNHHSHAPSASDQATLEGNILTVTQR